MNDTHAHAHLPAENDLLESFAESLSSMDYTALCIMNHKSREDGAVFRPQMQPHPQSQPFASFAPPTGIPHQMDPGMVFNPSSLADIEKMHWQYLDGHLKYLYENDQHMGEQGQQGHQGYQGHMDNRMDRDNQQDSYNGHISHNSHNNSSHNLLSHSHSHNSLSHSNHNHKMMKVVKGNGIRAPSAAAKERRRERNKVLARKTRVKKKAQMETMRDQVMELMEKNEKLRAILTKHAPESVNLVKVESHRLPDNILALVQQQLLLNQRNEINMLTLEQSSFCVVSATHTDSPIIYASPAFYSLTGYSKEQVVGHNCRFLQGPETDRSEVSKLTSAIVNRTDFKTVLLNYCKDGSTFYNKIQITHLQGEDGVAPFIIGLQSRVPDEVVHDFEDAQIDAYEINAQQEFLAETEAQAQKEGPNPSFSSVSACTNVDTNTDNTTQGKGHANAQTKMEGQTEGQTEGRTISFKLEGEKVSKQRCGSSRDEEDRSGNTTGYGSNSDGTLEGLEGGEGDGDMRMLFNL